MPRFASGVLKRKITICFNTVFVDDRGQEEAESEKAIVTELSSRKHPTESWKMLVPGLQAGAREYNFFLVYTSL